MFKAIAAGLLAALFSAGALADGTPLYRTQDFLSLQQLTPAEVNKVTMLKASSPNIIGVPTFVMLNRSALNATSVTIDVRGKTIAFTRAGKLPYRDGQWAGRSAAGGYLNFLATRNGGMAGEVFELGQPHIAFWTYGAGERAVYMESNPHHADSEAVSPSTGTPKVMPPQSAPRSEIERVHPLSIGSTNIINVRFVISSAATSYMSGHGFSDNDTIIDTWISNFRNDVLALVNADGNLVNNGAAVADSTYDSTTASLPGKMKSYAPFKSRQRDANHADMVIIIGKPTTSGVAYAWNPCCTGTGVLAGYPGPYDMIGAIDIQKMASDSMTMEINHLVAHMWAAHHQRAGTIGGSNPWGIVGALDGGANDTTDTPYVNEHGWWVRHGYLKCDSSSGLLASSPAGQTWTCDLDDSHLPRVSDGPTACTHITPHGSPGSLWESWHFDKFVVSGAGVCQYRTDKLSDPTCTTLGDCMFAGVSLSNSGNCFHTMTATIGNTAASCFDQWLPEWSDPSTTHGGDAAGTSTDNELAVVQVIAPRIATLKNIKMATATNGAVLVASLFAD